MELNRGAWGVWGWAGWRKRWGANFKEQGGFNAGAVLFNVAKYCLCSTGVFVMMMNYSCEPPPC